MDLFLIIILIGIISIIDYNLYKIINYNNNNYLF